MSKVEGLSTQFFPRELPIKNDFKEFGEFRKLLANTITTEPDAKQLKFSGHAVERMVDRGIRLSDFQKAKLTDAVDRAEKKGSQNALILMGGNAFIVNTKNAVVVTAIDPDSMKDHVFTNIDSTIVV